MRFTQLMLVAALFSGTGAIAQKQKQTIVPAPPKVYVPINETYGDWSVVPYGKDGFIASTPNDNGSAIGVYCSDKGCSSFVNPQITCEEDAKYPVLINAPSAAYSTILTCIHVSDRALLFFDDEKPLTDAMSIGGNLGVAFPMKAGDFKVSRFSLTGALRAYARAAQLGRATPKNSSKGVGDSRL